jgi:hypothetical protein
MIKWVADIRNLYKILSEKHKQRKQHGDLYVDGGKSWRNTLSKCRLVSIKTGYFPTVNFCEHANEPSESIKA